MKRNLSGSLLTSLAFLFLITSCTRIETTDLGSELIPAVDNVNTFLRILDVKTDNQLFADTTRIFNQNHAIGLIANDPQFGKTEAITYVALEPLQFARYPFVKRDTVYVDSVVLSLSYTELYGDSNSIQQFEVREISPTTQFRVDSAYTIGRPEFPTEASVLGSKQINFTSLNDSVFYRNVRDTIRTINELRIKLDTSFGRRFVNYDTSTAFKNDSVFKTRFKGFEIRASEGSAMKNALAYFNLTDQTRTKLTFYCRVMNNGKLDTISPNFVSANDPHANIIKRTPANGFQAYLTNGSDNDDLAYLQSTPGSYATVKIPDLSRFADTNRVIHRAELVMDVIENGSEAFFPPPAVLFLDATNASGDSTFTITNDFVPINEEPGYDITSFGGILRKKQYSFNVSRYVQSIVTKKAPNRTLRVYAPFVAQPLYTDPGGSISSTRLYLILNSPVASGRVVIGGGTHPEKKMKLRIIYSEL